MATQTQTQAPSPPATDDLAAILTQLVGRDRITADAEARRLHSQDIYTVSDHVVDLVVAPGSVEELSRVVAAITAAGRRIAPRGAGMSYTSGYIPAGEGVISLDLSRMDRVLDIDPDDMTVTVEAGCTWAALNAALEPKGLRTPFWGPMSGLTSTVGGGLSQLNAMLGAGHYGTSSESVVALTVVLADGSVLRTGARRPDGSKPSYRHFGPDLAGLFCGDTGVFGIKAEITLRLMRRPAHEDYVAFAFDTGQALLDTMAEIARADLASETCAFDPGLTRVRMKRGSLAADVKTLGAVVAREKSLGKGLVSAARVALGGRKFVEEEEYSVHVICDGRSAAGVADDIASVRAIARARGGREIENTIAKVIRAVPFPPLNSVLGPEGERWTPVHGVASLSQAPKVFAAVEALFARLKPDFDRLGVHVGYLFTTLSTNALIVEPVFYWPEARHRLIERTMEPQHLAKLAPLAANPDASALVARAKAEVIDICAAHGCGFFQIGRTYPYRESRDPASWALLEAVKTAVDPSGALNPGGLGFDAPGS